MRAGPEQTGDALERLIHFHGLKKKTELVPSGAIEYHYFFLNDFEEPVAVNGVPVAKNMVAGPLPDFALIDIGGFVVLWWGSRAGVEYCPAPKTDVSATPPPSSNGSPLNLVADWWKQAHLRCLPAIRKSR
jgi:hypothetical protein